MKQKSFRDAGNALYDIGLARAQKFLEENRFTFSVEPLGDGKGQTPDFLTVSPTSMWIEAKTLKPQLEARALGDWLDEIRARAAKISAKGRLHVWISETAQQEQIAQAFRMLRENIDALSSEARLLVVVPNDARRVGTLRFDFRDDSGAIVGICATSPSKKYGAPPLFDSVDSFQVLKVTSSNADEREFKYYEVVDPRAPFAIAILAVHGPDSLHLGGLSSAQGVYESKAKPRIRSKVREAYSQLRAGYAHTKAPCLVFVYDLDFGAHPDRVIPALYGDLTAFFDPNPDKSLEVIYGRNGVFRPTLNRKLSAVVYACDKHAPVVVHNYWAIEPLRVGTFRAREYQLFDDGKIRPVSRFD